MGLKCVSCKNRVLMLFDWVRYLMGFGLDYFFLRISNNGLKQVQGHGIYYIGVIAKGVILGYSKAIGVIIGYSRHNGL